MTGHRGAAGGTCTCDVPGFTCLLACGCWTWTHGEPLRGDYITCGTSDAHQSTYAVLEVRPGRPHTIIIIGCDFCHQARRKDDVTAEGMRQAAGAYVAHLIESHWDKLQAGRVIAVTAGNQGSDNWTRI